GMISLSFSQSTAHNNFNNKTRNTLYITKDNGSVNLNDIEKYTKNYYTNPVEILKSRSFVFNDSLEEFSYNPSYTKSDLIFGRMPENDDEICINFDSSFLPNRLEKAVGKTIYMADERYDKWEHRTLTSTEYYNSCPHFKVVGVGRTAESQALFGNEYARKLIRTSLIRGYISVDVYGKEATHVGGESHVGEIMNEFRNVSFNYEPSGENVIYLTEDILKLHEENNTAFLNYEKTNLKFNIDISKFKIEVTNELRPYITINDDYKFDEVYNVLAYNISNTNKTSKKLGELGYYAISPFSYTSPNYGENTNSLGVDQKLIYILICSIIGFAVAIYLITYTILKLIFRSKKTDYNIIRTLGVTNKPMSHIVNLELFLVAFIISTITYIVLIIIKTNYVNNFLYNFRYMGIKQYFIFILLIIILSFIITRRFNKKLFNQTVRKQFEGEGK
ncbi:MAG: hypothetical protein K6G28_02055, partial [Acholeplasmatales bacterium]|nr:hypothetical protein [Acholeplasmatales bacterium]